MLRIIPVIFFRFVFPLTLLLCCLVRPSLLSLFYGLFVLVWPFVPNVDAVGTPACTKRYLVTCIFVSSLAVLAQLIFHITLLAIPPYGHTIPNCSETDYILRTVGLQRLDEADPLNIARIVAPDITSCLVCVITAVVCFLYQGINEHEQLAEESADPEKPNVSKCETPTSVVSIAVAPKSNEKTPKSFSAQLCFCLLRFSDITVVILLALIAVIWPCVLSSVYFITFLLVMTWWSIYLPLKRPALNIIKIVLLFYCGGHLVLLYLYQLQVFQEQVEPFGFVANLTGLIPYVRTDCTNVWVLHFVTNLTWSAYVNPFLLFLFYIYCSFQYLITAEGVSRNRFVRGRNTLTTLVTDDDVSSVHEELLGTEEDDDAFQSSSDEQKNVRRVSSVKRTPSSTASNRRVSRFLSLGASEKGEMRPLASFLGFIVRHSYALALITMMAWAITYHCWLSFVWLVLACGIWLATDSRKFCFWLSPFIVFYAEALLCLEFIYDIRSQLLTTPGFDKKWPDAPNNVSLQQIGLVTPTMAACIPLSVKLMFSIPFWLTLRLFLREKYFDRNKSLRSTGYGTFAIASTQQSITGSSTIGGFMVKYWIYVVGLVLLLISIRQPVVAYAVCYMLFFVVLITVLQISFKVWRFMLYIYWLVLVTFSILVLLAVYVYQFHGIPQEFYKWTHWPNGTGSGTDIYKDLGLIEYDSALLFVQLLTPISFLIVVIMQLKFFHSGFMRMTNVHALLNSPSTTSQQQADQTPRTPTSISARVRPTWIETIEKYYTIVSDFLWRVAEIHIAKVVAFALMMLAVYEVCAVNFVFVLLIAIMLSCRSLHTLLSVVSCLWAAAIVLAKMMFQMTFVNEKTIELASAGNCTIFQLTNMYPSQWAGFVKTNDIGYYLKGYVIVFVLLTFQAVVHIRQKYRRVVLHQMTPARGILFPNITRRDADESIIKCFQYLVNYFFYKFGVEVCFIVLVVDIGVRMDGVAFLYAVCLLILVALPRNVLARFWYVFVFFLAIFIPLQYAVCVGLPPSLCIEYPWSSDVTGVSLQKNLIKWLYLPAYEIEYAPNARYLIADFFVFLLACCQLYVFNIELSPNGSNFEGGDNAPIDPSNRPTTPRHEPIESGVGADTGLDATKKNPVPNFITYTKSYLDLLKMFVFVYFHWITLVIIFVAGVGSNSLFALFYLIAVFALLWKGNDLYLESDRRIKCRWYAVIYYNIVAIILKVGLQIVGCVFWTQVCNKSALVRLFSITCLRSAPPMPSQGSNVTCGAPIVDYEEAEILYDGLCFAFLIIQLRIFGSWYFKHTIGEFRAERILSSRGAALINQLIMKEMKEQQEKESKIYDKIIAKTTKIREKYVKQFQGKKIFEAQTYPDEQHSSCPMYRSFTESIRSMGSNTYAQAKRGGDYYMYECESDNEEDILELEPPKDSLAPEISPDGDSSGIGPIQLAHKAVTKDFDFKGTVEEAEADDKRRRGKTASTSKSASADIATIEDVTVKVDDDEGEDEEQKEPPGKIASACRFVGMFLSKILDQCSFWFNKWSRDYRYVGYVLKQEKRLLKDSLLNEIENDNNVRRVRETVFHSEIGRKIQIVKSDDEIERVENEAQTFYMEHNVVVRFFIAAYYLIVSHTELICWIMIILNQMGNASVLSLPLPFLAFFWGTLCSPRPPIFFWVTLITYTEAMIIVKCICQFGIFFNDQAIPNNEPFYPTRIIGVEKKDYYAAWDVTLLMILFFHRYVLKSLGLWKDVKVSDESAVDDVDKEKLHAKKNGETSPNMSMTTAREVRKEDTFELQELTLREDKRTSEGGIQNLDVVEETTECETDREAKKKGRLAYCTSFQSFYQRLLHPAYRYIMDLYAMMFLCDVICFLILAFGYSSFGVAAGGDVVSDIQSNKVPLPFVVMLISLMLLIIVDRGIYLRKNVVSKLIFQYLLVLAVHIWIFFALPGITDKSVFMNTAAQLWYFVKCIYFLLSAWQIRNGYPSRILGNLLTKRYNMLNYGLFTGFMAIPFVFELRTLIDWIWTDTCLPLFDYFTMENIYATVYRLKCMRKMEKDYPVPKGTPKGALIKYGMGCPILLLIVILLWLPLLLFALVNAIGLRLVPVQARFTIVIEGYPPLYSMDALNEDLNTLTDADYASMSAPFSTDKAATTFLRDYTGDNTQNATFRSSSLTAWGISAPSREALNAALLGPTNMKLAIQLEFTRPRSSASKEPVKQTSQFQIVLDPIVRRKFSNLLSNSSSAEPVRINESFPQYIEIPSIGQIQPANALLYSFAKYDSHKGISSTFSTLLLSLEGSQNSSEFWTATMLPMQRDGQEKQSPGPYLQIFAFIDKVFPAAFDAVTSGGIIGVYVIVVLAAGKFFRGMVVNSLLDVIINEMPNVDRVLQLCLDVFLVREARDFNLELDLFAKLIFLFRSPETLIRWTRPKLD